MTSTKTRSGTGFVVLHTLRVLNIIALLAVAAASWMMLVKTSTASRFFFFDAVSHIIVSSIAVFLIVSELPILKEYFAHDWPLLSLSSGFVTLGAAMIVLGFSVLGSLDKPASSQEALGLAFWRVILAAGIISIVMGVSNVAASYIFREKDVTARQVRLYGATAREMSIISSPGFAKKSPSITTSTTRTMSTRQPRNSARFMPGEPAPAYQFPLSRQSNPPRLPLAISNPIISDDEYKKMTRHVSRQVERPDDSYHPSHQNGGYSNVV